MQSRDCVVGTATRYGLVGPGTESRWGRDFPHLTRPTSEAKPASYSMGTGSFTGVKRPGRGAEHPPHPAPRLKKEYSYILLPLSAFVACSTVNFTFYLQQVCAA